METKQEQILVRITGQDRPGLTASVMAILAKYDAQILDIGQADIHSTLSLGILIRMDEMHSGQVMKELLFKATELGVNIGFSPISDDEYEDWVGHQGRYTNEAINCTTTVTRNGKTSDMRFTISLTSPNRRFNISPL